MEWTVALNKNNFQYAENGTAIDSKIIYIPVGKVALLSMYGMAINLVPNAQGTALESDSCGIIMKLTMSPANDLGLDISACESPNKLQEALDKLLASRTIFKEDVVQCTSPWALNPCNNFSMIPTPGMYQVRIYDVNQLDDIHIEYALLDVAAAAAIPDDFKLGS